MQPINYCLFSPTRDIAMSCNATPVDSRPDQPARRCDYVDASTLPSHYCHHPATRKLVFDDTLYFHYCDYHFVRMVLCSLEYKEHLSKWDRGEVS